MPSTVSQAVRRLGDGMRIPFGTVGRCTGCRLGIPSSPWKQCKLRQPKPASLERADNRKHVSSLRAAAADSSRDTTSAGSGYVSWEQKVVTLPSFKRGCHVVTSKVMEQLPEICEFEDSLDRIVPEGKFYRHLDEGLDDMPAHVKSSLMGPSLDIPIRAGSLALGTWQGIYLNEHRDSGGARSLVVTMQGQKRPDGRKYPAKRYRW